MKNVKLSPGWRQIVKEYGNENEEMTVESLKEYLIDILKNTPIRKDAIVVGKFCPHKNRLITIGGIHNECSECMAELISTYVNLNGIV